MMYWVVMFDRDGGELDPEGPFECQRLHLTQWGWTQQNCLLPCKVMHLNK
jgi:hypothetical protein